jgi:hypothetical protein
VGSAPLQLEAKIPLGDGHTEFIVRRETRESIGGKRPPA